MPYKCIRLIRLHPRDVGVDKSCQSFNNLRIVSVKNIKMEM